MALNRSLQVLCGCPLWPRLLYACAALSLLSGCVAKAPPPGPPPRPVSLAEVMSRVNDNNSQIPLVYKAGRVRLTGRFADEAGRRRRVDLNGGLLYRKPRDLYLDLHHLLTPVLRVGSNDQRYWMWLLLDIKQMVWGKYEHLDRPDIRGFALRPDQVIEALGVNELPAAGAGLIGPLRRTEPERNVLTYFRADQDGGHHTEREYYLDRRWPFLIRRLVVRGALGEVVLDVHLDDYKPIAGGPLSAKTIRLSWPENDAHLRLELARRSLPAPDRVKARAFAFPAEAPVPADHVVQIDRQYDQEPAQE